MQRKTRQRDAIRAVFLENPRPLRVEEVHEFAQSKVPQLGIATVYRNLKLLIGEGEIVEVPVPELGTLYERAGIDHHHHFYCRRCRKLFDFPGCPIDESKLAPPGFSVDSHELFLFGVCYRCNDE
ncbi:MAG: transcriptional repressor [Candidatus Lernaella stagnicola]|nr:transcriptional repressor [Candidatus Lernaella stagnicola]